MTTMLLPRPLDLIVPDLNLPPDPRPDFIDDDGHVIKSLAGHMRLGGQRVFSSPVVWNRESVHLPRAARVLNALLAPLGLSLEKSAGLEALEHLLLNGRLTEHYELGRDAGRDFGFVPRLAGGAEMADYLEREVMEHVFKALAIFAAPADVKIALYTTDPLDAISGAEVANVNGYARQANAAANWTAPTATNGQTDNAAAITFPIATGSWGTVSHFTLPDSLTWGAGNAYFHSPVDTSKAITTDDTAEFGVNALVVTLA